MTENLKKEIQRYPQWARENAAKQLGRYKGWMIIGVEAAKELQQGKNCEVLFNNGYMFIEWSTLSGDSDDRGDFAISLISQ